MKQKKLNLLSFDPSFRNWGVAHMSYSPDSLLSVHSVEVIQIKPTKQELKCQSDLVACMELYKELKRVTEGYTLAVAEIPTGSQTSRGALASGICLGLLAGLDINLLAVTPTLVKRVVGGRYEDKKHIVDWVNEKHPNVLSKPFCKSNHEADAVVAAYAALPNIRKCYEDYYCS